jgi:hypothetical protein
VSVGEIRATITEAVRAVGQATIALRGVRDDVEAAAAEVARITTASRHPRPPEALSRWHEASVEADRAVEYLQGGIDHAQRYLALLA